MAASTQETAILTVRNGGYSVVIDKVDSPLSVRMAAEIGARGVLYAGASNLPLLAFGPEELREKYLSGEVTLKRFTDNTASDAKSLSKLLDAIRQRGYHVSKAEVEQDIMAVGAPVFDRQKSVDFCISVAGPLQRMEPREEFIIREVMKAAERLSSLLAVCFAESLCPKEDHINGGDLCVPGQRFYTRCLCSIERSHILSH